MPDDDWNWKSKLTVLSVLIFMFLSILLYVRGCVSGDFFNNPSPDDPTMRPIGSGQ